MTLCHRCHPETPILHNELRKIDDRRWASFDNAHFQRGRVRKLLIEAL